MANRFLCNKKMETLFLLLTFISLSALACVAPHMGEEFDALIEVKRIENNKFKVIVSKKAKHLDYGVDIFLAYYKTDLEYRLPERKEILSKNRVGNNYISEIEVKPIEGLTPFIMVSWEPEMCCLWGAIAYSGNLVLQ